MSKRNRTDNSWSWLCVSTLHWACVCVLTEKNQTSFLANLYYITDLVVGWANVYAAEQSWINKWPFVIVAFFSVPKISIFIIIIWCGTIGAYNNRISSGAPPTVIYTFQNVIDRLKFPSNKIQKSTNEFEFFPLQWKCQKKSHLEYREVGQYI